MSNLKVKVGRLTGFHGAEEWESVSAPDEHIPFRASAFKVDDETFLISEDDARYDRWTRLLRRWPRADMPIYVEAEAEAETAGGAEAAAPPTAKKIVVPALKRILGVSDEPEEGRYRVVPEATPTIFFLSVAHPRRDDLLALLRESEGSSRPVYIFTDPDSEPNFSMILDARPAGERAPPVFESVTEVPARDSPAPETTADIEAEALRPFITFEEAQSIFQTMATDPDIPFCYLEDCCTARAHRMCRLMREMGVASHKVWNYGSGTLATPDPKLWRRTLRAFTSTGTLRWTYHTAPVVNVELNGGAVVQMVIDPSLLTGPDTVAVWRGLQNDAAAQHRFHPAHLYWINPHSATGLIVDEEEVDEAFFAHQAKC